MNRNRISNRREHETLIVSEMSIAERYAESVCDTRRFIVDRDQWAELHGGIWWPSPLRFFMVRKFCINLAAECGDADLAAFLARDETWRAVRALVELSERVRRFARDFRRSAKVKQLSVWLTEEPRIRTSHTERQYVISEAETAHGKLTILAFDAPVRRQLRQFGTGDAITIDGSARDGSYGAHVAVEASRVSLSKEPVQ